MKLCPPDVNAGNRSAILNLYSENNICSSNIYVPEQEHISKVEIHSVETGCWGGM